MTFLLPYVERTDIWNQWNLDVTSGDGYPPTAANIKLFVCPSDPPDAVNTGIDGPCGLPGQRIRLPRRLRPQSRRAARRIARPTKG